MRIESSGAKASRPGASKYREMWRPKSMDKKDNNVFCPHCGHSIKEGYAICPHCGRSLTPGKCSFCGAAMKGNARFCTSCGQSREGVICPKCGTLNSRNFCRKCNEPLTPMGQQAFEAAKKDPAFKKIEAKAQELAELHQKIEELRNTNDSESAPELSEEDKALLDEYADILNAIGTYNPPGKETQLIQDKQPAGNAPERKQYSGSALSLEEIMKAYREKAEEMNEALSALTPPPDYTPEQQRDYYSARKVLRQHQEADLSGYNPSLWCCNYCGCLHNCPSECAEPQLGGTWIYESPEEYMKRNPWAVTTSYTLEEDK